MFSTLSSKYQLLLDTLFCQGTCISARWMGCPVIFCFNKLPSPSVKENIFILYNHAKWKDSTSGAIEYRAKPCRFPPPTLPWTKPKRDNEILMHSGIPLLKLLNVTSKQGRLLFSYAVLREGREIVLVILCWQSFVDSQMLLTGRWPNLWWYNTYGSVAETVILVCSLSSPEN